MSTSDRVTLSALVDHSTAPKILDIHLDDCDDEACAGCEPQHLTQQAAGDTILTAEALLELMAFRLATGTALVEPNAFASAVKAYRAQVLREAAVVALSLRQFDKAYGARSGAQVSENVGIIRVADELARLADGGESRG